MAEELGDIVQFIVAINRVAETPLRKRRELCLGLTRCLPVSCSKDGHTCRRCLHQWSPTHYLCTVWEEKSNHEVCEVSRNSKPPLHHRWGQL